MAALEDIVQKNIEKRCHFVGSFDIGWLGLGQNHFDEFRCNLTDDNLAVRPVGFFQFAVFESQLDPFGFFVPAVDFKGLCGFQSICDQRKEAGIVFFGVVE